jgi:hypothetical protein
MVADAEARVQLLKLLDNARTFDELLEGVTAEYGAKTHTLFGTALRFLAEGDPDCLDDELQERFAQVLSRFVESRRGLALAGILETGDRRDG